MNDRHAETLPYRVTSICRRGPEVAVVRLQPANGRALRFLPGQHVDIVMPDGTRRSYSIANAPTRDQRLELHVRRAGGSFSSHVFQQLEVGDALLVDGPHGAFRLHAAARRVILLATGTGFAPIKALLEDSLQHGLDRRMDLYWAGRILPDLYMLELPRRWQRCEPEFRFVPVLSDAEQTRNWRGRIGQAHEAVLADYPDLRVHHVYACGAPDAVGEARLALTERGGLPKSQFISP